MNPAAHTETRPAARRPLRRHGSRSQFRPTSSVDRVPSDMAVELLTRIIEGLGRAFPLSARERELLRHFLFGHDAAATGERLGIRETSVHKHLHRIYAKSGTNNRRGLLQHGLRLANRAQLGSGF
ncbi:LuxR C-terminal-related transcriptional regulator [Enhygromyxa salina]|uniref:Bacterial regulatory protein, luxR family n=1 Tax=Enhygromyxa salina TaxID=215803 RepID=A0A2S9YKQ6_9BACT|nr:LuxR C-terminal-related transcriptional regulator [Enhygromyxa salina]PRQ05669.1 Bacterial regulatory protein, luxR family [Enhygromyxa salina]